MLRRQPSSAAKSVGSEGCPPTTVAYFCEYCVSSRPRIHLLNDRSLGNHQRAPQDLQLLVR
jgi:hypothetical protein